MFAIAFLFQQGFIDNRTTSYLSLDITSGDCSEVPQTVTGVYLADTSGNWNTMPEFKYTLNAYAANLLGLTYTTAEWKLVMKSIQAQVAKVAGKSIHRDYA